MSKAAGPMRGAAPPDARDDRLAALERENAKLRRINTVLMDRVERGSDHHGSAFALFETAISLDALVSERTAALEAALADLARVNLSLKDAHAAADAARQRLRDAIESINEGFALFDPEDRLVLCNEAYRSLWPEVADRIVEGAAFTEIIRLVAEHERPRGADIAPDRWLSDRLARHSVAGPPHVQALADGRFLQINELRTSEGGIVGIYTDITDTKAEDAAEHAREVLERNIAMQAMLDSLSEGVCLFDEEGRLTVWNGALQTLLRDEELLGAGCDRFAEMLGRRFGLPSRRFAELPDGERTTRGTRVRDAAGRRFDLRWVVLPRGALAFSVEDVTERENLRTLLESRVAERTAELVALNRRLSEEVRERTAIEEQLREAKNAAETASRSKTSFIAAASHDLLQPLNAARLFTAALQDRRLAPPTRALVSQTASALDSVDDLLEALLEISRLDAGAIQPEIQAFPLDSLLATLRAEFVPIAGRAGLDFQVCEGALWVSSDVRLLRRILQNLLSNAIRYTQRGSVRLACRAGDDTVEISVSDTGSGIAPADQERIFEEFHRLETRGRTSGKGLGLAIVRRAAATLGHGLRLDSEPGRGSTFAVTVPVARPGSRDAEPAAMPRGSDRPMRGRHILVIDNEATIAQGMATLLEGWGCRVSTVATPAEAVRAAVALTDLDLIVADYHLDEGATGAEAIAAVRATLDRPVAAMVISADRTPELRSALTAEGLPLLGKPVKPAQLRALMRTMLD